MILVTFGAGALLASMGAIGVLCLSTATSGVSVTQRRYLAAHAGGGGSTNDGLKAPRKVRRVLPFAVPIAIATWLVLLWMVIRH
jgi:prepilin signal peptidase PulO-like enzyme (type II secretory pathway)